MFATGLAFLAGVFAAALVPQPSAVFWLATLPPVMATLVLAPPRGRWHRLMLWLLAGAMYASGWSQWRLEHRLQAGLNDRRLVAVGEVESIPRLIERKPGARGEWPQQRFLFRLQALQDEQGRPVETAVRRLRLSWRGAPRRLEPGQVWRLPVRLRQPHGYRNPGAFDYERWLWLRGIDATGWVRRNGEARQLADRSVSLNRWRYRIVERLRRLCAGCAHGGLVQALSVGHRGELPRNQRDLLRQTGTAHLVAISGLHIGIIAFCFHWLGRGLWRIGLWRSGISRRTLAWTLAFGGGLVYALLSGLALPALRAVIMLGVMVLALWTGRPQRLLHSLGLAVILVLLIDPLSVLSASFWLSFGALCVIAFGLWRWPAEYTASRWLPAVRIQWLFSLLFLPMGLAVFGEVHRASLFANLLAVPLVSLLIVPFNFLLLALSWLPDAWIAPGYRGLDGLLALLMGYLDTLRAAGLTAWPLPESPGWVLWLLLAGLLALLLPRGLLRGRALWLLLPLPLLWPRWDHSADVPYGSFVAEVLDVGMGTAVVIRTREHSLIYDFGPGRRQGFSMGNWAVLPLLRTRGITRPQRIVLSHEDQDHIGGFLALTGRWPATLLETGTLAETRERLPAGLPLRACHGQPPWRWDGVSFRYLDAADPLASENDRSCVLRVASDEGAVLLLTGDIERVRERGLLEQGDRWLRADVLLAPHHGSESSSTADFIEAVAAGQVVFTSGFRNRWGFPRPAVLRRYRDSGARLWNTAVDGALRIGCAVECRIRALRRERPRPWQG